MVQEGHRLCSHVDSLSNFQFGKFLSIYQSTKATKLYAAIAPTLQHAFRALHIMGELYVVVLTTMNCSCCSMVDLAQKTIPFCLTRRRARESEGESEGERGSDSGEWRRYQLTCLRCCERRERKEKVIALALTGHDRQPTHTHSEWLAVCLC